MTEYYDIVDKMALRRIRILVLLLVVNGSFIALFNAFSATTDHRAKPKPFFGGRRLMDLNRFQYIIDSDACEPAHRCDTPILVHSYVGHFEIRQAIRQSYSQTIMSTLGLCHVFMIGLPYTGDRVDDGVQQRLLRESSEHGDIVQGDFHEAYRNLTYKHVMGLTWFAERCSRGSGLVVKTDDDIAVNAYKLKDLLVGRDFELAGCVIRTAPIRNERNKWHVTRDEFAGDAYPPFLSGWLYVATAASVDRLLQAIRPREYFWIDDLYVTGILAQRAGISLTDLRPDFEIDPGPIHCCIRKLQRCEFLAAPTGDDHALLQQYSEKLTRCKSTNLSCDAYRKSKRHHSCMDLWKKHSLNVTFKGKPSIEILN